jgi:arginase
MGSPTLSVRLASSKGYRTFGTLAACPFRPVRDTSTAVLNPEGIRTFSLHLAERVAFTLEVGRFPLVLGGDCLLDIEG